MKQKIIAIIPSRMGATRFPGKPMAEIENMPMIGHVYHRTIMCNDFDEVFVATCDNQIADYIQNIGGNVVMTSPEHLRSTDRVAEALQLIEEEYKQKFDIVVMIQGDEPLINDQMVANSISPIIINPEIEIVNLMTEITDPEEISDPNSVKIVVDYNNFALYMSRSPIPYEKRGVSGLPVLKKVNVTAMKHDFLLKLTKLKPTPLELVESIGLLRVLENGQKIKMVLSQSYTVSVDSPKDIEIVKKMMKNDFWKQKYITKK